MLVVMLACSLLHSLSFVLRALPVGLELLGFHHGRLPASIFQRVDKSLSLCRQRGSAYVFQRTGTCEDGESNSVSVPRNSVSAVLLSPNAGTWSSAGCESLPGSSFSNTSDRSDRVFLVS